MLPTDKKSERIISDLTSFVTTLCKKNNIKYKKSKHSNISIHIKDFSLFEQIITKNLPKQYEYQKVLYSGAKIINHSTTFIAVSQMCNPEKYSGYSILIDLIIPSPRNRCQKKEFKNQLKDLVSNSWLYDNYPKLSSFNTSQIEDARQYSFYLHSKAKGFLIYGPHLNQNIFDTLGFYDPNHSFTKYQKIYRSLKKPEKEILQKICSPPGNFFQFINSLEYQTRNSRPHKNTLRILFRKFLSQRKPHEK